jgi:mRNA interferase MazF
MRRGDVFFVDLDPYVGNAATKTRPAVIVSNDAVNRTVERVGRGVVTLVPVTSHVDRIFRFQVLLPAGVAGLRTASKAQAEQVRSVDVARIGRRIGALGPDLLAKLDDALRIHLDL